MKHLKGGTNCFDVSGNNKMHSTFQDTGAISSLGIILVIVQLVTVIVAFSPGVI